MLINFNTIVAQYGKPIGIIHIGAHLLEEREDYLANGIRDIIWIEANPKKVSEALKQTQLLPTEKLYNYAITDTSNQTIELFCTNNGQSSSILKLNKHLEYYPDITVTESLQVTTKRVEDIISEFNLDLRLYDFVNIDIQGAELKALMGFGSLLHTMKYLYLEVNKEYLYDNCALVREIDDYLVEFGFIRRHTKWTDQGWGDALYIKAS